MSTHRLLLATLLLLGCGGGGASAPPGQSPVESPPPSGPSLALVEGLAAGEIPWSAHVDEARGVAVVEVYTDAAAEEGEEGEVRSANRHCGPALEAYLEAFTRDLRTRREHGEPPLVRCEESRCVFDGAMEFDRDGSLRFEGDRLVAVVRVETPAIPEEIVALRRAWAEEALAALPETCP